MTRVARARQILGSSWNNQLVQFDARFRYPITLDSTALGFRLVRRVRPAQALAEVSP